MSCQICLVQLVHLYSAFICPYEQPMYFCFCDVSNVCHHLQSKHVRIHNPHWQCRCPKCSFTNMEGIICAMLGTGIFPILPESNVGEYYSTARNHCTTRKQTCFPKIVHNILAVIVLFKYMGISKNAGTQRPWVSLLKMIILGCFGGTTI